MTNCPPAQQQAILIMSGTERLTTLSRRRPGACRARPGDCRKRRCKVDAFISQVGTVPPTALGRRATPISEAWAASWSRKPAVRTGTKTDQLAEFWRIRGEVQPPDAYPQFRVRMAAVCKTVGSTLSSHGPTGQSSPSELGSGRAPEWMIWASYVTPAPPLLERRVGVTSRWRWAVRH